MKRHLLIIIGTIGVITIVYFIRGLNTYRLNFKKIAFGDDFLLPISGDFRSPSRFDLLSKSGGGRR